MRNFRDYKNKIISSKRDSQKIEQLQLLDFSQVYSLPHLNSTLGALLKTQLHSITQQNYKINNKLTVQPRNMPTYSCKNKITQKISNPKHEATKDKEKGIKADSFVESFVNIQGTEKKITNVEQKDTLSKILELMSTINFLQQQKPCQSSPENHLINTEIKEKLSEFKELLNSIQSKTQSLDFYNEPIEQNYSPNSFNSRSSDEAYQQQTERQAYEFTIDSEKQQKRQVEDVEIRYKRINLSSSNFQDENDTFCNDEDDEDLFDSEHNQEDQNQRSVNQNSIIHLYSYEKEKYMETPLSSITERQSEYCSPDSKKLTGKSTLSEQNLQYKKIQYLLQTSEKKRDTSTTTNRHDVSEFTIGSQISPSDHKRLHSDPDRSRCNSQLMNMIQMLETKYNRKVKSGSENFMDALNATLNSKYIRPRIKK